MYILNVELVMLIRDSCHKNASFFVYIEALGLLAEVNSFLHDRIFLVGLVSRFPTDVLARNCWK